MTVNSLQIGRLGSVRRGLAACLLTLVTVFSLAMPTVSMADSDITKPAPDLAAAATNLTGTLPAFVKLIVAGCYLAGIGLAGAAILKFKAHKDNPTQVPLGTPVALLFIAAGLLWMPSLIQSTGQSVFGGDAADLKGPASVTWDPSSSSNSGQNSTGG